MEAIRVMLKNSQYDVVLVQEAWWVLVLVVLVQGAWWVLVQVLVKEAWWVLVKVTEVQLNVSWRSLNYFPGTIVTTKPLHPPSPM